MYKQFTKAVLAALSLMISCMAAQAENVAIIVGVGEYANLTDANLPGIDNDVETMEKALRQAGYTKIIRRFDKTATKNSIKQAFKEAGHSIHKGDLFCFYQSSHGSQDHRLLTHDTTVTGKNSITVAEMKQWMRSLNTPYRHLILDACFSGGFKSRSAQSGHVKFYQLKQAPYRERLDNVVRQTSLENAEEYGGGDHVFFGSSQPNEPSLVLPFNGKPYSVFTYIFVQVLAQNLRAPWNSIVQPTVSGVQRSTSGRQTPVFNPRYLTTLAFSSQGNGGGMDSIATPIKNLGEIYDIANENADQLQLIAKMSRNPDDQNRFLPQTRVDMTLIVNSPGYLFIINRDNEDRTQMIGWGTEDLDMSSAEAIVKQSHVAIPGTFVCGKGSLKIETSARDGFERWKAFLFTDKAKARAFSDMWLRLTSDKGKKVRRDSFLNVRPKLDSATRIRLNTLYTAEVNYKVAAGGGTVAATNAAISADLGKIKNPKSKKVVTRSGDSNPRLSKKK